MTREQPAVLHVNDCASTAASLIRAGHERGRPWELLPLPDFRRAGEPASALLRRGPGLALWTGRLLRRGRAADVLHIHYGSVGRLARLVRRPYVLHLHGTDIRTQYDEPRWHDVIHRAVVGAGAVFFSTPDLAERTRAVRPDAVHLPVPVDLPALPPWRPDLERPRVVFASRWDVSKGVDVQLRLADGLVRALHGRAEVVGLDWGDRAREAATIGVRLLPRQPRQGYLDLLAGAAVVVGQSAGILAASELEAMAIGAPVAMVFDRQLYAEAPPPVLTGSPDDVVEEVAAVLDDPADVAHRLDGAAWVRARHDPRSWVDPLTEVYRRLAS